jgi:hypothetical protein
MPHPDKMRKPTFTENVAEAIVQKARSHRFLLLHVLASWPHPTIAMLVGSLKPSLNTFQ